MQPDIDARTLKSVLDGLHVGIAEVVGDEYLGLDDLCRMDTLLNGHRVGLVGRKECYVDILEVGIFFDIFGVSGDENAQAAYGQKIAVAVALGMELLPALGSIVRGSSFDSDTLAGFGALAVAHHLAVA